MTRTVPFEAGDAAAVTPDTAPSVSWTRAPARWRNLPAWVTETLLVSALYISYEVVRALAPSRETVAFANARAVLRVERFLHLELELTLNRALTTEPALATAASVYYQFAHETVALLVLVLLWRHRRSSYAALRTTLVVVSLIAVTVYWALPVAPPRMALAGMVDTVTASPTMLADSSTVTGLANLYAAMPSLHVGWAVWCALAVAATTTSRWRYLAWLYPVTTTLVVLATANHYLLDVVAGAALTAATWCAVRRTGRGPAQQDRPSSA